MGYKVGLLLSLVFVFQIFVLGGDILAIQFIYSDIDSVSMTAGYMISKEGNYTSAKHFVEAQSMVFICDETNPPMYGDPWTYYVCEDYQPLIIKKDVMRISVKRSVIIGFYN
ncbi:MAG: hypothetical protein WC366_02830 [Bacilli bacterium]